MNKRILVLDDDLQFVDALKEFLSALHYEVEVTVSPKHALEIMKQAEPRIVLYDYKMPEMSGVTFLEEAKKLGLQTIFMLVTAYEDQEIIDRLVSMGTVEVMLKPVSLNSLLEKVNKALGPE